MSRTGEPVVLKRMDFEKWFGPGKPNEVPVLKLASGKLIATQADDSDGDGKWMSWHLWLISMHPPA